MNKIKIIVIYEILGRPKEYIKTTLEQLIDRIGENTGIKIIERKVHEPHLLDEEKIKNVEDNKEVFSTFAEVELEVDNLIIVFNLILNTLPSSIEIIKPSELILKNFDLSDIAWVTLRIRLDINFFAKTDNFTKENLPIGLQLIGRPLGEETLLRIAYCYEQQTEWHTRRPSLA